MAVTKLKRKNRKKKARAKAGVIAIKRLNAKPPIKNIDIEAIKKSFENKTK